MNDFTKKRFHRFHETFTEKKISKPPPFEEGKSWENFKEDITPLVGPSRITPAVSNNKLIVKNRSINYNLMPKSLPSSNNFIPSVNLHTYRRIKKERIKLQNKLDLHGYNLYKAYETLKNFILFSYNNNLKYLLVITGKGKNDENTIKSNFLQWLELEELRNFISECSISSVKHGGEGAFYITLKL